MSFTVSCSGSGKTMLMDLFYDIVELREFISTPSCWMYVIVSGYSDVNDREVFHFPS